MRGSSSVSNLWKLLLLRRLLGFAWRELLRIHRTSTICRGMTRHVPSSLSRRLLVPWSAATRRIACSTFDLGQDISILIAIVWDVTLHASIFVFFSFVGSRHGKSGCLLATLRGCYIGRRNNVITSFDNFSCRFTRLWLLYCFIFLPSLRRPLRKWSRTFPRRRSIIFVEVVGHSRRRVKVFYPSWWQRWLLLRSTRISRRVLLLLLLIILLLMIILLLLLWLHLLPIVVLLLHTWMISSRGRILAPIRGTRRRRRGMQRQQAHK